VKDSLVFAGAKAGQSVGAICHATNVDMAAACWLNWQQANKKRAASVRVATFTTEEER
jgi:hypothetical protein